MHPSSAYPNVCWSSGGMENVQKDCSTTLPSHNDDKSDKVTPDTSPTVGCISYTLTASTPKMDLSFKGILKEWTLKLAIGKPPGPNWKIWKDTLQPAMGNVSNSVTPGKGALGTTPANTEARSAPFSASSAQTPHKQLLLVIFAIQISKSLGVHIRCKTSSKFTCC